MESLICSGIIILIIALSVFSYLRNTARKKTAPPATGKKDFQPVYISIADKPDSIMRGMDRFVAQVNKTESAGDKWRWIPMIIFLAGLGLMAVDGVLFLLGYTSFVFIAGGFILWIAAVVLARGLRKSDSKDFSPRYKGTKDVLYTLRDDLKPGSTFNGHLDLTGALLKTKVARETKDSRDRTTQYFRDEWLALKAKLYDGNILRVSAIQRSKQRQPYWKRSRVSGKMKQKPAKFKGSEQQLKVRIAVNPDVYKIVPNNTFRQGGNVGNFTINQLVTEGGIISAVARSSIEEVGSEQILNFVKSAYSLLERKASV
ncbi:MAG TPA: hypothetical protein VJ987_09070 [Anaerolineales bacterium]|nr:hypothetical protein [Anaerolineales bacterium]